VSGEVESLAGQRRPGQVGLRVQAEPFLHRSALVGVEPLAVAAGHELVDARAGQLDHEPAADEHREDLPPVAERTAAEPAAALRREHPVLARELVDQVFVPLLRSHPPRMTAQLTSVA
jgi:hypothetical protein